LLLLLSALHICTATALTTIKVPRRKKGAPPPGEAPIAEQELSASCTALIEAEVFAAIGTAPVRAGDPFIAAFEKWLGQAFAAAFDMYELMTATGKWQTATLEAYDSYFWGDSPDAAALREFLIVGDAKKVERLREIGTLRNLTTALTTWVEVAGIARRDRQEAWERHIQQTKALPDKQGTMFNESFGVRKVFQPPLVRYHINGRRPAAEAETIADVGGLFGGLISNRVSSQDLVVVSGGPGSGKSTLCRVLASKMAATPGLHPVFLKLRKAKDGSDIMQFVEDQLKERGLIDRIADLWRIPNLVLILDGFDELAMSSRSRLRRFFNILGDELREGPLGRARVIVSGRDTLFPGGEGLPPGSHVVALQPFDRGRVAAWGAMWRRQHNSGPGHAFHPEELMREEADAGEEHPLTHLVRWPLTLHLIAQIHTAGRLTVSGDQAIEKAYLYRSILQETAARQEERADGEGRMDAARLRQFLRSLAWEMYQRQTDSMDPVDVEPLLQELYRDKPETERAELAEVAVVNAPELTKGEETGFEFVHKSFSEFLVAEHLAGLVESVIQKVEEWDTSELTWRRDEAAAVDLLAPALAIRPLPQEVQEMLEPMLGVLVAFGKGEEVGDDIDAAKRRDGLLRIIERFERLYAVLVGGRALEAVTLKGREHNPPVNPLEAHAHFGLGLVLIGAAAARRLKNHDNDQPTRFFRLETSPGQLTRFLSILQSGGISLDDSMANRMFAGSTIRTDPKTIWNEERFPAITPYFRMLDGYSAEFRGLASRVVIAQVVILLDSLMADAFAISSGGGLREWGEQFRYGRRTQSMVELLIYTERMGLVDRPYAFQLEYLARDIEEMHHRLPHYGRHAYFEAAKFVRRIDQEFTVMDAEDHYRLSKAIDEMIKRIDRDQRSGQLPQMVVEEL